MNKVGIGLLSGVVGLAVGVIGTYIFLKKKYEDDYYWKLRTAIDEECERLRANHTDVLKGKEMLVDKISCMVEDKGSNSYQERIIEVENMINESGEEGPRFIDEDEFRFLPSKYEIRELQYYTKDGVVLDQNDEIVEDAGIYISGLEERLRNMNHYETAWILVDHIGVAVEIVVLDESYSLEYEVDDE